MLSPFFIFVVFMNSFFKSGMLGLRRYLAIFHLLALSVSGSAESLWPLGESDPGAVAGSGVGEETVDSVSSRNLNRFGGGVTYSSDVAADLGGLCVMLNGSGYFTAAGEGFYEGMDLANFEVSCRVKPTAVNAFHVPMCLGRYGSGAAFVYVSGTSWNFHVNGQGDRISGAPGSAILNEWQSVVLRREDGVVSLVVNGSLVGTTTGFPATFSDDFTIGSALNGSGGPDGRFIGLIDRVRLSGIDAEPPPPPPSGEFDVTFESLLGEMVGLDGLAKFPLIEHECLQASTYNRGSVARDQADQGTSGWFADGDGGGFIRTEVINGQQEWVVMEHDGPGALTRYWTPFFYQSFGNRTGPRVRIYLDGSTTPVIDENLIELLSRLDWDTGEYGSKPVPQNSFTLPEPFANFTARAGVMHLPIPFGQSCKVTLTSQPFYNIINYRAYPEGTEVRTFTADDLASPALEATAEELLEPGSAAGDMGVQTLSIPAGGELVLGLPEGPAVVSELEVDLDEAAVEANPALLRSLVIVGTFDGNESVWCPVGDFFSSPARINAFRTLARTTTVEDGRMICRWRMPYESTGVLRIINTGSHATMVTVRVKTSGWDWDERSMHFHARWRPDDISPGTPFHDWNFVEVQGKGVLVGDSWTVLNLTDGWWGEGDEKIYVDEEYDVAKFPSHFGTGTEDYYGWAGGVVPTRNDEFATPFEGNCQVGSTAVNSPRGFNVSTRARMLDAIPFRSRLVFDMEASPGVDQRNAWDLLMYSCATFWYAIPGATSNRPGMPEKSAIPITPLAGLQARSDDLRNGGPGGIDGAIEAEAITPSAVSPGVTHRVVTPLGDLGAEVSGGAYREVDFGADGDFVEFRLTEQFTERMVRLILVSGPDGGEVDVFVNGKKVLDGLSLESEEEGVEEIRLGLFQPQDAAFVVRVVNSGGAKEVGIDAFRSIEPKETSWNRYEWRMGEDDAGAELGEAVVGGSLMRGGDGELGVVGNASYTEGEGGGLAVQFEGQSHLSSQGAGFLANVDYGDFELSFKAKPGNLSGYQIAVALGRYGSGSSFIYQTSGSWRFHLNGGGDLIAGAAGSAVAGVWQEVKLVRRSGVTRLYVDGEEMGSTESWARPADDFTVAAAINGSGGPDGRFSGAIDQVVLSTGMVEYGDYILTSAPPDANSSLFSPGADADGDGATNLLEFLFNTDAFDGGSLPPATIELREDGSPEGVSFPLSEAALDLVYWEIEWSADLRDWEVFVRQPHRDLNGEGKVVVLFPEGGGPRGFVRLTVPGPGYAP